MTEHVSLARAPDAPPPKKRGWLAWLVVAVVVGLLLVPVLHKNQKQAAGRFGPGAGGPGGTVVTTETVKLGAMPLTIDALGTVTPLKTVSVYSQVTGRVLDVHYQEGQLVHAGDVLVDIDQRPTEAQLQQAEGSLKRDKATLDQANINLKRYQDAYAEKALAQQTVFDQEQTYRQTEGTVQNDQGLVNYYRVQLSYYKIVAPITGRIGLRLVDPGNTVFSGSGTTIATITQVTPITTVFAVAEDHLPKVRAALAKNPAGLAVDLFDRSLTKKLASGTLTSVDNQIDTSTGTVRLRAVFPNDDESLYPNQFVNARLQVDVLKDAKLVPTPAIQYNGQQGYVYVVKADGAVKLQNVTVLVGDQTQTAVEGLDAGSAVVTSNFDRLTDGAKVTVAPPKDAAGRPDAGAPGPTAPVKTGGATTP